MTDKVRDTRTRYKAVQLDYNHIFGLNTSRMCFSLSEREVSMLISALDVFHWRTRWYGENIADDNIKRLVDGAINQLMNPVQCGEPTGDEDCFTYLPNSPFIEWFPHDPFSQPDLVTDGYNLPAWYVSNEAEKSVMTDISRFPPGSLPTIIPASGLPRFRLHLSSETGGICELHLISMVAGSLCQVTVDDNPLTVQFVDLDVDITSIPPETGYEVIVEIEVPAGNHHIDCIIVSQVNESIPFLHHGGGLKSVVLCGVGVGQSMYTPEFRFENCVLEYTLDGVTWLPVTGWPEGAAACFQGEPGEPGQDGQDGCSPTVWVETRPSDGHKILWIDADCDEQNDYEVDLTQESAGQQIRELSCRFARAFPVPFIRAMSESVNSMILAYPLGETLATGAFAGSWPFFVGTAGNQELSELYQLGEVALADLKSWYDEQDNLVVFGSDIWFADVRAEWNAGTINTLQSRVLNDPVKAEAEKWAVRMLVAAFADAYDDLRYWSWTDGMAWPLTGDCSQFEDVVGWEQQISFAAWDLEFGVLSGDGINSQFYDRQRLRAEIAIAPTFIDRFEYEVVCETAFSGFGLYALVMVNEALSWQSVWGNTGPFSGVSQREWKQVTYGLRVVGEGANPDSTIALHGLTVWGTGTNPFV